MDHFRKIRRLCSPLYLHKAKCTNSEMALLISLSSSLIRHCCGTALSGIDWHLGELGVGGTFDNKKLLGHLGVI